MKYPLIAALILPLAACTIEQPVERTTIVSSVTPEQRETCVTAVADARGVSEIMVTQIEASATPTGPLLTMQVMDEVASCKLDELGEVENVTFS